MLNSDVILMKRMIKALGNIEKELIIIKEKIDHFEKSLAPR
jgi:hypothetical protein